MNIGIGSVILAKINELFHSFEGSPPSKEKVVLIGYGWAGKAFADRLNTNRYELTVISDKPAMLNTTRMKNSLKVNDANLFRFGRHLIKTETVQRVDLFRRQVHTAEGPPYTYDYLVVATGSLPNDFNVPGVKDHCHFFKSPTDLEKLRQDLRLDLDQTIAIVGAGPTGLELAFELHAQGYKNITLVEAQAGLLPTFSPAAREMILSELQSCGITVKFNTPVIWVEPGQLKTKTGPGIPFDVAIWNCGIKPSVIPGLTGNTDDSLRLNGDPQVFAIGDITRKGPPTAQNAKQQGIYLAKAFNRGFQGFEQKYTFQEKIKVLHTKEALIIDIGQNAFRLPKYFDRIYNLFI